jgi:hypothetical protein
MSKNKRHLFFDIQGCIFKMCRNFTYEVVEQRRRLKAIKKNCSSKKLFCQRQRSISPSMGGVLHFVLSAEPQLLESNEHWRSLSDGEGSKERIMNENVLKTTYFRKGRVSPIVKFQKNNILCALRQII